MKKIIALVAMALSLNAYAAAVAESSNKGGGKIVLSDGACYYKGQEYKGLNRAFTYVNGGESLNGCWAIIDGMVVVSYEDGTQYRYTPESFIMLKGKK